MKIRIMDRDIEILKFINRFGLVKKISISKTFKDKNGELRENTVIKRLRRLANEKYLKSEGQAYGVGIKGRELLEDLNVEVNYSRLPIGKSAIKNYKDNDVILNLNFLESKSRIEYIKELKNLEIEPNKVKLFCGKIKLENKKEYIVYRLPKDTTNLNLAQIVIDAKKLGQDKILIVFDDMDEMKKAKEKLSNSKLKEILIIPNIAEGFEWLKLYNNGNLNTESLKSFFEKINKFERVEIKNNYLYLDGVITLNFLMCDLKEENSECEKISYLDYEQINILYSNEMKAYFNKEKLFKTKIIQKNISVKLSTLKNKLEIK